MIKVKIYTIGKCKDSWLLEALVEYEKRLSKQVQFEWVLCKNDEELELKAQSPWISLSPEGELLDSPTLSKKLMKLLEKCGSRLNILIGGSDGIPKSMLAKSVWIWSLSPLTFTHQMTRLLLLEQVYRAFEIESGSDYHK
jgi:23S rRNA (pseudouridine1915-N3)-methyltransferase